jgi:protein dithiol oxidoreductase (disulfide-forming)
MKKLFFIFAVLLAFGVAHADEFKEGVEYKAIEPQPTSSGDKVEVLEFFWYGCPHCYAFEPTLENWLKNKPANVEFTRIPAAFRPSWILHARLYYALEILGQDKKVSLEVFDYLHKQRRKLDTIDTILDFVSKHGIDRSEFLDTMNSFAVETRIRKSQKLQKDYAIDGVPAIAINGKYIVTGSMAGNYDNMIKVMDYLIAKESKKPAGGDAAGAAAGAAAGTK